VKVPGNCPPFETEEPITRRLRLSGSATIARNRPPARVSGGRAAVRGQPSIPRYRCAQSPSIIQALPAAGLGLTQGSARKSIAVTAAGAVAPGGGFAASQALPALPASCADIQQGHPDQGDGGWLRTDTSENRSVI